MYAAVLQAHLTGKALKVFSTLSVEELRDYPTVKAAILDAYSVVPEVYRKRFRGLTKGHSETEDHCSLITIIAPNSSRHVVRALRDTGALQSLVSSQTISESEYFNTMDQRLIKGVTGEVVSVPLVSITLKGKQCNGTFLCGLVPTLPVGVDVLIGNDLCPESTPADVSVVTRSQTAALRKQADHNLEQTTLTTDDNSVQTDSTPDMDLSSLFHEPEPEPIPFELVNRAELIRLQQGDPELSTLFDLVGKTGSPYEVVSGVLVRNWRDKLAPPESNIHQIVVPTILRAKILQIGHDIPAAGHLGVAKTKSRILRHFYWNTVSRDVKAYCKTCDTCQRLGKGAKPASAPLHSLPLVTEPFSQVAIDIIGPLPACKVSGNRFILTVLDLCTHFQRLSL